MNGLAKITIEEDCETLERTVSLSCMVDKTELSRISTEGTLDIKKLLSHYRNFLIRAEKWLDSEIKKLDDRIYYADQPTLTRDTLKGYQKELAKWVEVPSISTLNFNFSLKKFTSKKKLSADALQELESLIDPIDSDTWAVIIEASKVVDLNIFIAQMLHIQMENKKVRFFVVTDSEEILLKIVNVFNWHNRVFYTLPSVISDTLSPSVRNSVTYECLTKIRHFIHTDNCSLFKKLHRDHGKESTFTDPHKVFVFDCSVLSPHPNNFGISQ